MRALFVPFFVALAAPVTAATATMDSQPDTGEHGRLPEPVSVVAPTPSSGLSEDLLARIRIRLLERTEDREHGANGR